MTADGKRKPRYGFGDIVMPTACHGSAEAANLTVPIYRLLPQSRLDTDYEIANWFNATSQQPVREQPDRGAPRPRRGAEHAIQWTTNCALPARTGDTADAGRRSRIR